MEAELTKYVSLQLLKFTVGPASSVGFKLDTYYSPDAVDEVLFRQDMMVRPEDFDGLREFLQSQDGFKEDPSQIEAAVEDHLGYKPEYFWRDFTGVEKDLHEFVEAYNSLLSALAPHNDEQPQSILEERLAALKATRLGRDATYVAKPGEYWDGCFVEETKLLSHPHSTLKISLNREKHEEPEYHPGLKIGHGAGRYGGYINHDLGITLSEAFQLADEDHPDYHPINRFDTSKVGVIQYNDDGCFFVPIPGIGGLDISLDHESMGYVTRINVDSHILGTDALNKLFKHLRIDYHEES